MSDTQTNNKRKEKDECTPPSTPQQTTEEDKEDNIKFEKSLTENLNNRFYANNNNNTDEIDELDFKNFKTIKDFGYFYNDKLELRSIKSPTEKFKFINQEHYDKFGDLIVEEIQRIMKNDPYNLDELWIPEDQVNKCNIFTSKDFKTNSDKLMILVNGSGAVRSGQWARSLCINDSLHTGSILPYLKDAQSNGYSVIVLNPNFNYVEHKETETDDTSDSSVATTNKKQKRDVEYIQGSESSNKHILWVWDNIISKQSNAKEIVIVAHSFGGVNTCHLLDNRGGNEEKEEESMLTDRLTFIGFTDSVHSVSKNSSEFTKSILGDKNKTRNWVRSNQAVNTDLGFSRSQGCQHASSGHTVHEYTSSFCKDSLFNFILKKE